MLIMNCCLNINSTKSGRIQFRFGNVSHQVKMKLSIIFGVLVAILGALTITDASEVYQYGGNYGNQPRDITSEINAMIPRLQAYVKRINKDPLSIPNISTKLLNLVQIMVSNGWLNGLSTTDAIVEQAQFYQENGATYVKGRARVGKLSGNYNYQLNAFGANKSGTMGGHSGGGTFDFGFRLDHNTFNIKTTHLRIIKYQDIKLRLDNVDLTWLVTNNSMKPLFDLIVRQVEKVIISITNDIYHQGTSVLQSYGVKPTNVEDIHSVIEYLWNVLEQAAQYH